MSLSIDGVWKAGVWATTVWADGVWREGAPTAPTFREDQLGSGGAGQQGRKRLPLPVDPELETAGLVEHALSLGDEPGAVKVRQPQAPPEADLAVPELSAEIAALEAELADARKLVADARDGSQRKSLELYRLMLEHKIREIREEEEELMELLNYL